MCLYPSLIKNKKYTPNQKNGGIVNYDQFILGNKDKRVLTVPVGCGDCMECRKQKANEWQIRMLEDVRHHKKGKFITLTFSNEKIKEYAEKVTWEERKIKDGIKNSWVDKNGKLRHRYKYKTERKEIVLKGYETDNAIATLAVREWLERWRKKYKKSLRHWLVTELGHKGTENIHLHGIVWTDEDIETIKKTWKNGFIWIGETNENGKITNYVNEKTVNYITKYINKIDLDHKYYKSKILTSAGIGAGYMSRQDSKRHNYVKEKTREFYVTKTGHKVKLPMYYRRKIWTDDEIEELWIEKLNKEVRYILGKEIDISTKRGMEDYYNNLAFARRKNGERGFGNGTKDWNRKKYEEDRRNLLTQDRITTAEEKELLRRGFHPDATAGESINNSLRSQDTETWQWKRDMGWSEDQIIWGIKPEEITNDWWR